MSRVEDVETTCSSTAGSTSHAVYYTLKHTYARNYVCAHRHPYFCIEIDAQIQLTVIFMIN